MSKFLETLYTDELFDDIEIILGSSDKFIKMNKTRRQGVQNNLSELCILATHTSIFNVKNVKHNKLEDEYRSFNHLLKKSINNSSTRKNSSDINNKIRLVCLKNANNLIVV